MRPLARPRRGRIIGGVCSSLGNRFGISATVVRLLFIVSLLLPGPQFVIYIALWIVIPAE